jgi:hypothetical protein
MVVMTEEEHKKWLEDLEKKYGLTFKIAHEISEHGMHCFRHYYDSIVVDDLEDLIEVIDRVIKENDKTFKFR